MLIWILGVVLLIVAISAVIGWSISGPVYTGTKSDHFNGETFTNPDNIRAKGLPAVLKWMIKRDQGPWTKNYETTLGSKPVESSQDLRITFINHSTFLIQWNDLNILTDPIWSERCSPFSFVGPSRMRPPGIRFEDLPPIDIVLLSHNHYDHLDLPTIKNIETKHHSLFVTPLGVGAFLKKETVKNVLEMDWWDDADSGIKIKAVPAQHFSGRGMFDRDKTLWSGYVLEFNDKRLYFAGDSGYGAFFKEIGEKAGPMDVALIPIGAYLPKWFMSPVHISPEEAVQVHQDVKSKQSIAMHFGTFPLADEGQGKAEEDLILALDSMKISQKEFIIPDEGKAMDF